jgi:SAM-dependent methyltransferase
MSAAPPTCEICAGVVDAWELEPGQLLGRCRGCGHVHRDLDSAPAAHRGESWGGGDDLDRVRLALTYRRLRGLVRASGGERAPRVFEAGYGSGALLRRFLDDGAQVAGADPGALGRPVDPVVSAGGGLVTAPVEHVTQGRGSYDVVLAVHVVEHVPDPWVFVAACRDMLRRGGVLAVVTPAGDSTMLPAFGSAWWMLEDATHVRFFSRVSLALLLTRSGLTSVDTSRPVADSLAVEAASWLRRGAGMSPREEHGALARPAARWAVAVSLPAVLVARAAAPRWRPCLQAVAVRP